MADEADSKSVGGNVVWVQVPPPAFHKKERGDILSPCFIISVSSANLYGRSGEKGICGFTEDMRPWGVQKRDRLT